MSLKIPVRKPVTRMYFTQATMDTEAWLDFEEDALDEGFVLWGTASGNMTNKLTKACVRKLTKLANKHAIPFTVETK